MPKRITVYMHSANFSTTVGDAEVETVRAAAREAWNDGKSQLLVVCSSEPNRSTAYINLAQVALIEFREAADE